MLDVRVPLLVLMGATVVAGVHFLFQLFFFSSCCFCWLLLLLLLLVMLLLLLQSTLFARYVCMHAVWMRPAVDFPNTSAALTTRVLCPFLLLSLAQLLFPPSPPPPLLLFAASCDSFYIMMPWHAGCCYVPCSRLVYSSNVTRVYVCVCAYVCICKCKKNNV